MKLGISGFSHETVSFWPGVTDLKAFERTALYGEDVIKKRRGTNSSLGGFLDICEPAGIELYPILAAQGGATATVADEVYDHWLCTELWPRRAGRTLRPMR
jgi:microcystin degradation protein MlrC